MHVQLLLTYQFWFCCASKLIQIKNLIRCLCLFFSGTECPQLRRRMVSRSKDPAMWMSNAPYYSCLITRCVYTKTVVALSDIIWSNCFPLTLSLSFSQPPQYKLDPRLARLLGVHTQTRASIMQALWLYIKNNKLQDSHEKEYINCNRYFRQVM